MMMDKGLSTRQMEDFLSVSSTYTDLIKFGFGTSFVSKNIKEKVSLLKQKVRLRLYFYAKPRESRKVVESHTGKRLGK